LRNNVVFIDEPVVPGEQLHQSHMALQCGRGTHRWAKHSCIHRINTHSCIHVFAG